MEQILDMLNSVHFTGIPLSALAVALLIIIFTLLIRRLIVYIFVKYIKRFAERSSTKIDEIFLKAIEGPLKLGILGIGFYIARLTIINHINERINEILTQSFQLFFIVVICWFLYRSTDLIINYLQKLAHRTPTELDDLLLPYLSKIIRVILVILVIIKFAEIFLGMSVAALLGILGGMGLTLGLVFKDIVANWFGCAIIYLDKLFKEGDWVMLDEGKVVDADVEEIGLRSTKFRNFDKTVSVVPNALIAQSVVKNWSRMYKRRVKYNFKIDGVPADTMTRILDGLRTILLNNEDVHQEFHMVNFREFEGNSRIIRLYYFTKTTIWKDHEQVRENVNLDILKLFENEGIDRLAYTIVDLSDDRPRDFSINMEKTS